jgi:hypothetical protein
VHPLYCALANGGAGCARAGHSTIANGADALVLAALATYRVVDHFRVDGGPFGCTTGCVIGWAAII